jgi:hydrogenase small subunit
MPAHETFYEVMRRHGVTRRSFLKFCSLTAAGLGLAPEFAGKIAHALETKPRTPVIWLHGLECTCCTESFIRSGNPLAGDVILSMISLDYDDTIMAAAGHQAEEILEQTIEKYDGQFILACEGNPPLNEDGMYCIQAGRPYVEKLRHMADHCKAIIAWGSCASWGCVQAARPNPTQAVPIHKVILDKPIVKVPGCPPIAEVMTGVITYMLAFDRLPPLDRQGRPAMFYGQRQVLPAAAFRCRPVRREVRRRGCSQGLLPVQGRLQGPDDLQRLLDGRVEWRPVLARQVGSRLSWLR